MLTPVQDPEPNSAEEHFNETFLRIRSTVERCNGVLKNRFRCLLKHRVLHYTPESASRIINACVVLHNMCITHNIPEPELEDEQFDFGMYIQNVPLADNIARNNPDFLAGNRLREQIIRNNFQ